jgi:aqualysin 1
VRVLDCGGIGLNSNVIAGVDWVTGDHVAEQPAVANMSLGGGKSTALEQAVSNSTADGVTYGVAAGNDTADACAGSPAGVAAAITVGATTSTDARASYSNFGSCVDFFAPGSNITSSYFLTDTSTTTLSGTSMATPHVVGVAALYLGVHSGATPKQVRNAIVNNATNNKVTNPGTGSPNELLFSKVNKFT